MSTIWIDKDTLYRVNILAPYKGFSRLDTPDIRERAGLIEIPAPLPPEDIRAEFEAHPDWYTVDETKDNAPPYVLWTRKSDEQIAEIRWNKIKTKRDELTDNGGCLVAGKWFHTDPKSKQQQMALTMLGSNIPAGLMWKAMDGSFVEMTALLAQQLFAAQVQREQTIFAYAEALKADINTDITAGWPERYEAGSL